MRIKTKLIGSLLLCCLFFSLKAQTNQPKFPMKFDLGSTKAAKGYIPITDKSEFTTTTAWGLLPSGTVQAKGSNSSTKASKDYLTSDKTFYFTVRVPEGRYQVKVWLGGDQKSETTVKAESRRLMVEDLTLPKGKTAEKTFLVDVRTPMIGTTDSIHRKPREMHYINWDNQLTLEFCGPAPCISAIEIEPAPANLPVIFLAGNSTVVDQEYEPWASWGQMFPYFLTNKVIVSNYAESGETLKAFRRENRLKKVLSVMKPGDYLFIEFAHNDQKPGGNHVEPFTTYQDQLRYYIKETKKRGGHPILVTSINRRRFDENGKIINTLGDYPKAMRQLAKEDTIPLIDLNAMSKTLFDAFGPEGTLKLFVHYPANSFPGQTKELADNTHFNPFGAYELAKCVVENMRTQHPDLAKFVRKDLPHFDPAKPDSWKNFFWPSSPLISELTPYGN